MNHSFVCFRPAFLLLFLLPIFSTHAQETSKYIVVDQFGYRPSAKKVAVIRNPHVGYDSAESFTPGGNYALINEVDSSVVFSGSVSSWKNGSTDDSSGDAVWWFDFSSVQTEGSYFVLDVDSNLRSYSFEIREDIYESIMHQAVRTFFYQRSGFAKDAPFACDEWVDGASHLQDKKARDFLNRTAATEWDVSGGWYDAGDFNKYTNWTSKYVVQFMQAFIENPGKWGDDYNIPESGNNIPDILDEAKWGVDHLLRLQKPDGSLLSVVGASHASPPSAAKGATYYGRPNTSGTLNAAAAFALASKVYRSVGLKSYADSLRNCAKRAYQWAEENPNVLFRNNEGNTSGLAAGQQETNDYGRFMAKLKAAAYLYEITAEQKYKSFFESNYRDVHLLQWTFAYPFETDNQEILLYYTTIPGVSPSVASYIKSKYQSAMDGGENFAAITGKKDPYMAHIKDYTWGSNGVKASQGLMFTDLLTFNINPGKHALALEAAEGYIHYLHGVNPFNMVYLSNMYAFGAENSVNEFYHSWFSNGSAKWDRVGESTYGPAPGFITGGANPGYNWDGCCPSGCGSSSNNARCYDTDISSILNQPNQKSYLDFNDSWPLNSWSVTENSCGYQLPYIRLLSWFIQDKYDCAGVLNGSASYDACGICSGGTTGIEPVSNVDNCVPTNTKAYFLQTPQIYPNPVSEELIVSFETGKKYHIEIVNINGQPVFEKDAVGSHSIPVEKFAPGHYFIFISNDAGTWNDKFVKIQISE